MSSVSNEETHAYSQVIDELNARAVPDEPVDYFVAHRITAHVVVECLRRSGVSALRIFSVRDLLPPELYAIVSAHVQLLMNEGRERLALFATNEGIYVHRALAFMAANAWLLKVHASSEVSERGEVRGLVQVAHGSVVELAMRDPDLCSWIVRRDRASHERELVNVESAESPILSGGTYPISQARAWSESQDSGLGAVSLIHKKLMPDEPWVGYGDRGFTWLGYRLLQSVAASPMVGSREVEICNLMICTTLVENVQASEDVVNQTLALYNLSAVGSGYVYWPEQKRIVACLTRVVHEETLDYRVNQLSPFQIIQLWNAEASAGELAEAVSGQVAFRAHPEMGTRESPDGILDVVDSLIIPAGQLPNRFADVAEFESVVEWLRNTPFASAGADAGGVCIEVPFGAAETTLIELSSAQKHPHLGAGLAIRTSLPPVLQPKRAAAMAAGLARKMLRQTDAGPCVGGWTVRAETHGCYVAWTRFVPNWAYHQGCIMDAASGEVLRAAWLDQLYFPELPQRNAWPIMLKRAETP